MTNDIRAKSAHASETALSVVSDWTPWAVALAPAVAIGAALHRHEQSWLIIVPVAVAVELGGVLAGHTLTEAREYNEFANGKPRNVGKLWGALLIYAAIGCVLSVLLDAQPQLEAWWPVALPLLAVVVYWVNGERIVIRRLRQPLTPASETVAPALPLQPAPAPRQGVPLDDLDRAIMAAYAANPTASKAAVARQANTTRQTVDNRLSKLQAAGLAHVNGAVYFNGNGGTH